MDTDSQPKLNSVGYSLDVSLESRIGAHIDCMTMSCLIQIDSIS